MPTVCAIIVTRNPDPNLLVKTLKISESVSHTLLVDNGSRSSLLKHIKGIAAQSEAEVIENQKNLGVATALNSGAQVAADRGHEWILTLDQDSTPSPTMVRAVLGSLEDQEEKEDIAIVAPRIVDSGTGREAFFLRKKTKWLYERLRCEDNDLDGITTVITAGAMIRLRHWQELGGFRDDFFIDYVDTEFCLRVVNAGYRIIVSCNAVLKHQFGDRRRYKRGPLILYPSFHPPERWYTISRNRVHMIRSFGTQQPHWLIYEIVATIFISIRMILSENERMSKIRASIHGTYDGLRGRLGRPRWAEETNIKDDREGDDGHAG